MAINVKCPKCGSEKVQCSNERSKNGCLWFVLFGLWFIIWRAIKFCIGLMIIALIDWWMAIIKKSAGKGYVWRGKKWMTGTKKIFFCHNCGHNFKA